jgi:hypothetical protein
MVVVYVLTVLALRLYEFLKGAAFIIHITLARIAPRSNPFLELRDPHNLGTYLGSQVS